MGKVRSKIAATVLLPLMLVTLVASMAGSLVAPSSTIGAASIAMTGSFYSQEFRIPAGSGVGGPSIYVKVSNTGTQQLLVKMSFEAPDGVTIGLSRGEFVLPPDQHEQVQVSVDVAATALSGVYTDALKVIAEAYEEGNGGASVSASAAQVASLTILNESANVTVNTVGPSGQPVLTQLRLFRMVGDKGYEVAYSYTGSLQARVVPGSFTAEAYSLATSDRLCDQNSLPECSPTFSLADGEDKTVTLTVRTMYFEGDFVVAEIRDSETKKLLSARTMATLTNAYQTMANAEVRLLVTFNGAPLEEIVVLGPLALPLGQTGVPWNYVPVEGWKDGLYGFRYQLYVDGELMSETTEQTIKVGGGGGVASWLWIIFVILGILGAAGLGFLIFFLLKRRKKEEEKPRKAEKKRKEEKPAGKAEEPVRKPEPYRPPEPVRPVAPPPMEEPTAEPAPLASISTLKARMASLGRDQGTGKVAEEEPDLEKKEKPVGTSPQASVPAPVPRPPKTEPERPAARGAEEKVQKPPAGEKPSGQKPGIFSKVTATGKHEPPKPTVAQGPAPVKPDSDVQISWPPKPVEPPKPPSDVQINWPPKPVEPPKPPSDVQINWPPKPAEPPKTSSFAEAARQRAEAQQRAAPPEEAASGEDSAAGESGESEVPPSRMSFAEAARLRMEARQRSAGTDKPGAGTEGSPKEGTDAGGAGDEEERPPSS